jgi:hypothetical protein
MNFIQVLSFAVFAALSSPGRQITPMKCSLVVNTTVKNPTSASKSDGEVTFEIPNITDKTRYRIFLINKGSDVSQNEIKEMKATDLALGFHDFIVIDTKGDNCIKEITIVLK